MLHSLTEDHNDDRMDILTELTVTDRPGHCVTITYAHHLLTLRQRRFISSAHEVGHHNRYITGTIVNGSTSTAVTKTTAQHVSVCVQPER